MSQQEKKLKECFGENSNDMSNEVLPKNCLECEELDLCKQRGTYLLNTELKNTYRQEAKIF